MRILVTGASRGIGRAICLRLVRDFAARSEGAIHIAACASRNVAELDAIVGELREIGADAIPLLGDVANPAVPARLVDEATNAFGGLDVVVSNAGIVHSKTLLELKVDEWDHLFAVNTRACWLLAKAAHPWLKESRGSFVAISSISGVVPHTRLGAYGPSKATLIMLVRLMAQEWGGDGVRVNCVSPGFVVTPATASIYQDPDIKAKREAIIPLHRIGDPYEDVASVVAFLAGPDSGYCTGQNIVVDGGLVDSITNLLPGRPK